MIFFRRRGWIILPLALVALVAPAAVLASNPALERVANIALLLIFGALVYWFGTRSLRTVTASLDRPLRAHEHVFDFAPTSPFDSCCGIHLRWWSLGFTIAAVCIGLGAL